MQSFIRLISGWFNFYCALAICFILMLSPDLTAQEKEDTAPNRDSVIAAAREIMGLQKYCALITIDSVGSPQIRTMNPFPPEEDMTVYMATKDISRKALEIKNNPNVCLYYSDHSKAVGYVAITGKAELVSDMNEILKRKRDYWDQSFPGLKDIVLIKVVPVKLDVLNYKRNMHNSPTTWRTPSITFPAGSRQ
ncbi:MAG: pyridoxamine 5'-phosphate oxidase family protein [Ignavibacteriaceae bacterium]